MTDYSTASTKVVVAPDQLDAQRVTEATNQMNSVPAADDSATWRGIFVLPRQRALLFTRELVLETTALPRPRHPLVAQPARLLPDD